MYLHTYFAEISLKQYKNYDIIELLHVLNARIWAACMCSFKIYGKGAVFLPHPPPHPNSFVYLYQPFTLFNRFLSNSY